MGSHFTETNILIGYTVDWDDQSSGINGYLDAIDDSVDLTTSIRAIHEATKVITDRRRPTVQAARLIFEGYEAHSDRPSRSDIIGFLRPKLDHLRDAVRNHVFTYIEFNIDMFRGLATEENERVLRLTIGDITEDFNSAIDVVDDVKKGRTRSFDCAVHDSCPDSYDGVYPVFTTVDDSLDNSPNDRDLVMDAFHLTVKSKIPSPVIFVTTDHQDILSNKQELASALPSVDFRAPSSFV